VRSTVVQAVSVKYGNDAFKIIYTPAHVSYPKAGVIIDADALSHMVSNGYTLTILPAEEANE
jgi:hypothetical protein